MTSTTPVPGWVASARYGDSTAPGGLGFVEELLNTAPAGRPLLPDLLADRETAQAWLDGALRTLDAVREHDRGESPSGEGVRLSERDLRDLRVLRDDLRAGLAAHVEQQDGGAGETVARGSAGLVLDEHGRVRLQAQGQGADVVRSHVLLELAVAELRGNRDRLKVCANEECRTAFYDQSRNGSRVWHDVRTCGNAANLRAYRQRLRDHTDTH